MAVPVTFNPGDVARSADVNADFAYFSAIVGASSTSSRLDLPGDILLGPRNNAQISSKHDTNATGPNQRKFMHIGMNLEYYDAGGGNWKYRRMINGQTGMSYRFSTTGLELWASSASPFSDPNPTMSQRWGVYDEYMYLPETYNLWATNGDPGDVGRGIQDYRTTTQFMNTPGMIYNGSAVSPNKLHKTATDYGASKYAVAILISGRIWTSDSAGARLKFYRDSATTAGLNDSVGFEISTPGGGSSTAQSGQGLVPLGTGSVKGRFVIEATNNITYAKIAVIGYSI